MLLSDVAIVGGGLRLLCASHCSVDAPYRPSQDFSSRIVHAAGQAVSYPDLVFWKSGLGTD